jgi:hypothetical protein
VLSFKEVSIGPTCTPPRVYVGRELDGDRLISRLPLSDYGVEEAISVTVVIAAPNFNDARQEYHPHGVERERLMRRARQAETGSHMSEWLRSLGLQPPK